MKVSCNESIGTSWAFLIQEATNAGQDSKAIKGRSSFSILVDEKQGSLRAHSGQTRRVPKERPINYKEKTESKSKQYIGTRYRVKAT